jgi:hypothetical protein
MFGGRTASVARSGTDNLNLVDVPEPLAPAQEFEQFA